MKSRIIQNITLVLPEETRGLFLRMLIGYDGQLQEDIEESFRSSSLSYLLAVSGSHLSYIILGISYFLKKVKLPVQIVNTFLIFSLLIFINIVGYTASITRATIMSMLIIISKLAYRKPDTINILSISILLILFYNPYAILDISFILSYSAIIGVIFTTKIIYKKNNDKKVFLKIKKVFKEIILITLYVNIMVMPILLYYFNTISLTFIFTNLLASIIIGPIMIGGLILILLTFIDIKIAIFFSKQYNFLLKLLINFTNCFKKLKISHLIFTTPNIAFIIVYYILLFVFSYYYLLQKKYYNRYLVKKMKKYKNKIAEKIYKLFIFLFIIIIFFVILNTIPKKLRIYFIDVGQGDSTVIITPKNKKILIDGGGSDSKNFDIGKEVLLPYLLDRKIKTLDYIIISHFDSDHIGRFIYNN